MSKGYAHPYLLFTVLIIVGLGFAVFVYLNENGGFVLGSKSKNAELTRDKIEGLKVTVISPSSSWDLMQYLCKTQKECEESQTSGKWWTTISGAPTTEDGHEVFIEKSPEWEGYGFLKIVVRKSGTKGLYFVNSVDKRTYFLMDISTSALTNKLTNEVVFSTAN